MQRSKDSTCQPRMTKSILFSSVDYNLPILDCPARIALDLGCGEWDTFTAAPEIARQWIGADIAPSVRAIPAVACKGESLPFRDDSFDLVIARLSLPYMHIPRAL